MTKGIKRELSIEEEVVELDRLLLAAMRRNLALAERLRSSTQDEKGRLLLERHQVRHVLNSRKNQETAPRVSAPESEADRRVRRFDRYLAALPDPDLQNVMDLVKSMVRSRRAPKPVKSKSRSKPELEGGEGRDPREADAG